MYQIKECVIVEGVYDKIKLSQFLDAVIFVTNGFQIYHDKKTLQAFCSMAKKTGAVILTDSDAAGFRIRSFLKQSLPEECIRHAYIPEIPGKERRKAQPGKEGILGVEGVSEEIILSALRNAGCTINGEKSTPKIAPSITKADFFAAGLSGGAASSILRRRFAEAIGLPGKISSNMLLQAVNRLMTREDFAEACENLKKQE